MTYFPFPDIARGRPGTGEVGTTLFSIPEGSLGFWRERLEKEGVAGLGETTVLGEKRLTFNGPDGDVFSLGSVHWGEALMKTEQKRLTDAGLSGECRWLDVRIPAESLGHRAMVILVDRYGNEKRLVIDREDFVGTDSGRTATKAAPKKASP